MNSSQLEQIRNGFASAASAVKAQEASRVSVVKRFFTRLEDNDEDGLPVRRWLWGRILLVGGGGAAMSALLLLALVRSAGGPAHHRTARAARPARSEPTMSSQPARPVQPAPATSLAPSLPPPSQLRAPVLPQQRIPRIQSLPPTPVTYRLPALPSPALAAREDKDAALTKLLKRRAQTRPLYVADETGRLGNATGIASMSAGVSQQQVPSPRRRLTAGTEIPARLT